MKEIIPKPINDTQRTFNDLCVKGGGPGGGPARPKVLELLRDSGKNVNKLAQSETAAHFAALPEANPWHVCFAIALSWGHLAKLDIEFTEAVASLLANWNAKDLKKAQSFHLERGPLPIEQSLVGAHMLFEKVVLPASLPDTLEAMGKAQERWLIPILNPKTRPPYIGAWNGTAMFMVALFANPVLAATHVAAPPALPPGGPIFMGLKYLHQAKITSIPPAANDLDDAPVESSVIYSDNGLFSEICKQRTDWSLIDVHSGIYMLGTRDPRSNW